MLRSSAHKAAAVYRRWRPKFSSSSEATPGRAAPVWDAADRRSTSSFTIPSSIGITQSPSTIASVTSCVTSTAVKPCSSQYPLNQILHLDSRQRVECAQRFVEGKELRAAGQRPGKRHALPLTAR